MKLPFKIDLTKLNLSVTLEQMDGYMTDYSRGQQQIHIFFGSQSVTLTVKNKKIYDSSCKIKVGEYICM